MFAATLVALLLIPIWYVSCMKIVPTPSFIVFPIGLVVGKSIIVRRGTYT